MLPSKGFFKKNDCPFFEKGLCVRPHCHFRHRKKVVNDHSPAGETAEAEENEEAEEALQTLIENFKDSSEADKKPSSSTSEVNELKEDSSSHDTLFAKLVNQTNTYEKINRHIPCAYTPTPQRKSVEPKNKSVNAVANSAGFANSEKSLELITKARTLLQNYCAENIKKLENKYTSSSDKKSDEITKNSDRNESSFNSKQDSSAVSDADNIKNEGSFSPCYVPSKETEAEGRYMPSCSDSNAAKEPKEKEYVPSSENSTQKSANGSPSEVAGHYIKKEGSMTISESVKDSEGSRRDSGSPNSLSELDFISSEIEMMKKLLNEDENTFDEEVTGNEVILEDENKKKAEEKVTESSHSNHRHHHHHKSSSRHKRKSSNSESSSRSKHSSSHSFRHSRHSSSSRHHSSSSRHHSSSSSRKSSSHHSSSSRHKGHREKSDPESEGKKKAGVTESDNNSKKKNVENHIRSSSCALEEDEEDDDDDDDNQDDGMDFTNVDSEDNEEPNGKSRKRKNSESYDETHAKYISLSNEDDFEDDPATVEKECLEIFNSYSQDNCKSSSGIQEVNMSHTDCESTAQVKKRTAHASNVMADHSALRYKTLTKVHTIKSAQDVMLDRYKIVEKSRETLQQTMQPNSAPVLGLSRPPIRIAAVSNIQQMLLAKKAIQDKISQGLKVNERTTIAHTVAQGSSRVAHVPKVPDLKEKPLILDGSKQVPRVKRQNYLDKLLIETNQIFPTKTESAEEALKLEQEIFRLHSGSTAAYHAAFVSLLMKTRRRVASVRGETTHVNSPKTKVSHFDVLSGGKKNFSVIKSKKVDLSMLTDEQIYDELLRCKLTPEQLKENGFPMSGDRPGYAHCTLNYDLKYNEKYQYIKKISGNRRYCIRCSKQYEVDPVTLKQSKEGPETCSYHPGKKKSGGKNCERVYKCCNSSSTEGCTTHVRHVTDCNDYENYPNCVRTLAKEGEGNPGVYALDCEMVYTRLGSELARVTVVNLKKEIVYDTLVKPKHPIECFNTFFSGIEEKMMVGVETTLKDVQAVLLSLFSNKTILIGHSLDSDLRALHLIHDTVVDTSIVYKNEKYFPYKYSLKDLCAMKISKIIQDNVNGHDSSEDAIAALEIMLQYVKEEVAKYDSIESYEADRGR